MQLLVCLVKKRNEPNENRITSAISAIEAIVHADLRSLFTTPSIHSRQPASQPVVGRTILPAMYLTWPRQAIEQPAFALALQGAND